MSRQRYVDAAKAFLHNAMKGQRVPTKVTLDAYAASHMAVADLKRDGELPKRVPMCGSKYLNKLIEQDHRGNKQRLRPMLGLKSFRTADIVISGIELAEKMKKGSSSWASWAGIARCCQRSGERCLLRDRYRNRIDATAVPEFAGPCNLHQSR